MILLSKIKRLNTCFLKYSAWSIFSTVSFYSALGIMILLLFAPKGASSQQDSVIIDFVTDTMYFTDNTSWKINTDIPTEMLKVDNGFIPVTFPYVPSGILSINNNSVIKMIKIITDDSVALNIGFTPATSLDMRHIVGGTEQITIAAGNNQAVTSEIITDSLGCILLQVVKNGEAKFDAFSIYGPCLQPTVKDTSFVICSGGQIGLDLKELVTDSAGASSVRYTWGAVDTTMVTGDEVTLWSRRDTRIDTTLHNTSNDYQLVEYKIAAYTDGNTNCADTASVYVTVFDTLQKPTLFPDSIKVCRFGMDEQIISSATGGSGEFSFEWKCVICPSGTIGTLLDDNTIYNPVFSASAGIGDYDLRLVVTDTLCMVSDSIDLHAEVVALPSADAGDDKDICSGSSTQLGIAEVMGYSYFWAHPLLD